MTKEIHHSCELILKMSQDQQLKKLRLLSRIYASGNLDFYIYQKQFFHILKQKYQNVDIKILNHCSLILAIEKFYSSLSLTQKQILNPPSKKSRSIKRDEIINNYAKIKELFSLGYSSRKIIKKLKLASTHVYLLKVYNLINN